MVLRFFLGLAVAAGFVSIAAFIWPRLTPRPRPAPLQQVYESVKETSQGKELSKVLGVADEEKVEPIRLQVIAGSLIQSAVTATQERVAQIVTTQAVTQLVKQYDVLPAEQKQVIQQAICVPAAPAREEQQAPSSSHE